jgi:curli biogenesis system outer membrane secretion channel CsgG
MFIGSKLIKRFADIIGRSKKYCSKDAAKHQIQGGKHYVNGSTTQYHSNERKQTVGSYNKLTV